MNTEVPTGSAKTLMEISDGRATTDALTSIPVSIESSGLTQSILEDIVARQLLDSGVCDINRLTSTTALSSRLLDSVIQLLRTDGRIEVLGPSGNSSALRYSLTDGGRRYAREARGRSGYSGPAPISERRYRELIEMQSVRSLDVGHDAMQEAYSDVIVAPHLLDRLGAAMHSSKAIFIYGPAGSGKTFLCSRLKRLLQSPVYIPHAVVVGDSIVRVFDSAVHDAVDSVASSSAFYCDQSDPRLVLCERPFISSGGELTMDMLEIRHDVATRQFLAPLQMKATHGIYLIDDLGRQKMSTDALFNRWIVPMESGVDYLSLDSGARLVLPFDVILIFSTNMLPEDLDDPAFQRRIGHKIGFGYADENEYTKIWRKECKALNIGCDESLIQYVIVELHNVHARPMLACHPRDLIGMALDYSRYAGEENSLGKAGLKLAWDNYFAQSS